MNLQPIKKFFLCISSSCSELPCSSTGYFLYLPCTDRVYRKGLSYTPSKQNPMCAPDLLPVGSFEPHTWRWHAATGMGLNLFWSKTPKCKKMQNSGLATNQLSLFDCWYCTKLFVKVEILTASKLLISVYKLQYESDFQLLKSQNSPHWKENIRIVYVVSIFQLSVLLNHSGAQIQLFILDQKPKQISGTLDSKFYVNRKPKDVYELKSFPILFLIIEFTLHYSALIWA